MLLVIKLYAHFFFPFFYVDFSFDLVPKWLYKMVIVIAIDTRFRIQKASLFHREDLFVSDMFINLFICLLIGLCYAIARYYQFVSKYPKGPAPLPFIGNSFTVSQF